MSCFDRNHTRVGIAPVPLSPEDLVSEPRRQAHIARLQAARDSRISELQAEQDVAEIVKSNDDAVRADWARQRGAAGASAGIRAQQDAELRRVSLVQMERDRIAAMPWWSRLLMRFRSRRASR